MLQIVDSGNLVEFITQQRDLHLILPLIIATFIQDGLLLQNAVMMDQMEMGIIQQIISLVLKFQQAHLQTLSRPFLQHVSIKKEIWTLLTPNPIIHYYFRCTECGERFYRRWQLSLLHGSFKIL